MKKLILLGLIIQIGFSAIAQNKESKIIPAALEEQWGTGVFKIGNSTIIRYEQKEDFYLASVLKEFIKQQLNLSLEVRMSSKESNNEIAFITGNPVKNVEGYQLNIMKSGIHIVGMNAGKFYGLQTLLQLIPDNKKSPYVAYTKITDQPRFGYRGLHLDVSLHMFEVSFIEKLLDLMARYKLNIFHWHLTDDQGWRVEIKKYPNLTKQGAYRHQTLLGHLSDPMGFDSTRHGGFYTQEEIKKVVAYAAKRHITIIPEIEMPGHCLSALASYPNLACGDNPGPFKVVESWGIYEDVFCAGKEETFQFLENVLDEVIALFPSTFIHIGGDEVPKTKWKQCKYCQKRIKENNLKDEHELQRYFISRMENYLNKKGRSIIGWDEILEGGLAPNATVMSWRGEKGGFAAIKQNHPVIMAPNTYLYFDYSQALKDKNRLNIGHFTPLNKVYDYDPTTNIDTAQLKYFKGVEACLWTEYMETEAKVEYMLLPRLFALSEVAWSFPKRKQYADFNENRVPRELAVLDSMGYHYFVPNALGTKDESRFVGPYFSVTLQPSVAGAKIYYTLDGFDPQDTDLIYKKPIEIRIPKGEKRVLKTVVITPSGKRSNITSTIYSNAQISN